MAVPAKVTGGTHWCVRIVSTLARCGESLLAINFLCATRKWFGFVGADLVVRVILIKVFAILTKLFHFRIFTINFFVVAELALGCWC